MLLIGFVTPFLPPLLAGPETDPARPLPFAAAVDDSPTVDEGGAGAGASFFALAFGAGPKSGTDFAAAVEERRRGVSMKEVSCEARAEWSVGVMS